MKKILLLLLLVPAPFVSGAMTSGAMTLKQKKIWIEAEGSVARMMAALNETCGSHIEWKLNPDYPWEWNGHQDFHHECISTVALLASICKDSSEGKKAVANKVRKIACTPRQDDQSEKYSLGGGTFAFTVSQKNWNQNSGEWLKRNLGDIKGAEMWAKAEEQLKKEMREMNSACNTEISFEFDKKSFDGRKPGAAEPQGCRQAVADLKHRCGKDDLVGKIAKKVKRLRCQSIPGDDPVYTSFDNGTLTYGFGSVAGSYSVDPGIKLDEWLRK